MGVAFLGAFVLTVLTVPATSVLQKGGYKAKSLFAVTVTPYFATVVALQLAVILCELVKLPYAWVLYVLFAGATGLVFYLNVTAKYTNRFLRLTVTQFAVYFVAFYFNFWFVITPIVCVVANLLNIPIESAINGYYLTKAGKKLKQTNAVKIAVTGSFGKTSVKQILCQLLPDAVATPYSYNTPLGIARFVNSTNFDGAKYVIFEMGARKPGDIFKLCNLVKPNVGVLTGICEQHLESFGSLDAVVKTKCELLRYLGPNDLCVINAFDQVASNCFGVGVCKKKLSSSVWERFCLVSTCLEGTVFVCNQDNCQTTFCSPLFGVAHFENVVLCVSVALSLGLNVEDIASKVSTLTPIEHRLQVLDGGQVTVVDDAYNANLEGVKKACQSFLYLNCKKIVISQGVVEGGSRQAYINNKVGQLLGEAFDVVVACGPNAKDIVAGVGNLAQVYLANSLNDAVGIAQTCYEKGAVCLFQNDIPKLF